MAGGGQRPWDVSGLPRNSSGKLTLYISHWTHQSHEQGQSMNYTLMYMQHVHVYVYDIHVHIHV